MNDYQEEKHKSNQLVVKVAKEHPESTALIPAFEKAIDKQDALNKEIEKIRILQEKETKGFAKNKKFTIENLGNYTIDISGAVSSYAGEKGNTVLQTNIKYGRKKISEMKPGEIIAAATTVLEEAKKVPAADLALQGITAEELKDYEDMIATLKTVSGEPREAIVDKSGYTAKLAALFIESAKLHKETLDVLGHQFKRKDPTFYVLYRKARKAIHQGGGAGDNTDGEAKKQEK
jgi:hypothetical protein